MRGRGGLGSVLLKRLPEDNPMSRIGVGTKSLALAALTIATALNTGWVQIGGLAAITAAAFLAARIPWRARPGLPFGLWVGLGIGFGLSALGGTGGVFLRLTGITVLLVALCLVVSWTTDLADAASALASAGAPLRRLGLPVDEWAMTTALSVRCLPLIIDECRVVLAARRERPRSRRPGRLIRAGIDVMTVTMVAAVRRGADLGETIALRGGPALPVHQAIKWSRLDLAAAGLVLTACILPSLIS